MIENLPHVISRFHDSYEPEPNSGCWIWFRGCTKAGYGQITVGHKDKRYAHRLSYELFAGPIADQDHVRHKCDTPCCVNPDHLLCGTNQDNRTDMARRNRSGPSKSKTSGLPQYVRRNHNNYMVQFSFRGKVLYLGTYRTVEEASKIAEKARKTLYGR
jgi:hypothetical protein